jgi:hypothetical protein
MAAQDFLARPKMHYVRVNMLRADADDAGGDAAKEWKSGKQAGEWRLERFCLTQHTRDNPPLHHHLQPLRLESPD